MVGTNKKGLYCGTSTYYMCATKLLFAGGGGGLAGWATCVTRHDLSSHSTRDYENDG